MKISEAFVRYVACKNCGRDGYREDEFKQHRRECHPVWASCWCCRLTFDTERCYFDDKGQPRCPDGCDFTSPVNRFDPPAQSYLPSRRDISYALHADRKAGEGWRYYREA